MKHFLGRLGVRCAGWVRVAIAVLPLAACGNEGTSPPPPTPATVTLSPANLADTIGAVLDAPVVVRVSRGLVPVSGVEVRLTAVGAAGSASFAALGASRGVTPAPTVSMTTDASGSIRAFVSLGVEAGNGSIAVDVPSLSLRDTVRVLARAGNLSQVTIGPSDTAVFVGAQLKLRIALRDRAGNTVPERAVVSSISGLTATVADDVFLAGPNVVRGHVTLKTSLRSDSVAVSVVPRDTMLFTFADFTSARRHRIVSVGLDGAVARTFGPVLTEWAALNPSWSADGLRVVSNWGGGYGFETDTARMYLYDKTSARTELAPNYPGLTQRLNPHFSRAGDWIFFHSVASDYSTGIWRIRPDGTGLEQLISTSIISYYYGVYPFADGKSVLVTKRFGQTGFQHGYRLDLATRVLVDIGLMYDQISISPRGDLVAWIESQELWVRGVDGGPARKVASDVGLHFPSPAWTRDGLYVVFGPTLIEIATGAKLPLPWTVTPNWMYRNAAARP